MNVKKTTNETIAHALASILTNTLPHINKSGLGRHLKGEIKVDPNSKGKSVIFNWNLGQFKVTENLCVTELDFTSTWTKTEEATKVENMVRASNIA